MFERFTDRARRVVVLAQEEARMLNHNYIGTEHILLGLIHEGEGVAAKALESLNISLEAVRQQVEEIIGQGQAAPTGHIPFTPRAKKVLELSLREALQLGHNYIGTEHILLGLIREGEGVAAQVLQKLGADLNRVRQTVIQLLSGLHGRQGRDHPRRRPGRGPAERVHGARPVRPQPHPARARRQARPGDRAREGDRAGHAGAQPPHEEQPGADRRARRRQDRRRRGPAPGHRPRRGARDAEGQADLHARPRRAGGRFPLPRRLRGAPQEGAEGDQDPRRHRAVHRRAAHARGRRRGRGRHRRRLDPQADARARRAADDRRDHARRVPQAPREGRRARAAVPADRGAGAQRRPHDRDPQGAARPLRGAPPRELHRRRARRGGEPGRPLHQRPVPARQGDRPDRRGRLAHAHPPHDRAARRARGRREDRRRAPAQGDRRSTARTSRRPRRSATRSASCRRSARAASRRGSPARWTS